MPQRRFLIATSLARLIRKEQGVAGHVIEGYFPAHPRRDQFVSLEPNHCYLVLTSTREGAEAEERTELPRSQAKALLAVCAGEVTFECTIVRLRGGKQALLQCFIAPGALDLLSIEFEGREDADAFVPPAWFGPEVTRDAAYHRGTLVRVGLPAPVDIPLANALLTELLDTLEEGALAAQLRHTGPLRLPQRHRTDEPVQAASSGTNPLPANPVDPVRRDALMAGRAAALQTFDPPQPRPAAQTPSTDLPGAPTPIHRYG